MYVPFQRAGPTPAPAIRGKPTAPVSKTRGHRQNLHVGKTQASKTSRRANGAIHRVRNANETRKPQASLHISDATHHNSQHPAGKRHHYVYAGGFSWLRRVSQVTVLFW